MTNLTTKQKKARERMKTYRVMDEAISQIWRLFYRVYRPYRKLNKKQIRRSYDYRKCV